MRKYIIKLLLPVSWVPVFFFPLSVATAQIPHKGPLREGKELTLQKSTVKGDVIKAMKIDLINLKKNRRERIERQLKNQVIIRKHFFQEKIQEQSG